MTKFYYYILGVFFVTLEVASALPEDETAALREAVRPLLEGCGKEFGVTKEQFLAAKKAGTVDEFDPCYFACFYKKAGFIDADGLFDYEVTLEKNKKYIKSEDDLAKLAEIGKICTSVNDQSVSDGDKGCERSRLLLSCFLKEKANFTPFESV